MVAWAFILALSTFQVVLGGGALSAELKKNFNAWLAEIRKEALAKGISKPTVEEALKDLAPIRRVIKLDRNQPEFKLTLREYLNRMAPDSRVVKGRQKLAKHRALLEKISQRYAVPPRFLVALWGIETGYGRATGNFSVIGAVATLAYDGRRSDFFRKELFQALRIIDRGQISAGKMRGSWAGAMGHFQFMPSTFIDFAVDHQGDGRIDIWNNLGDAFASAANYLSESGWAGDQNWGEEVDLPSGFDRKLVDLDTQKPLSEWKTLGLRGAKGRDLPENPAWLASVVEPDGPKGQAFLVYNNYRVILEWNRSHKFAIAVGKLADGIGRR
jgi:membrane-bound lytic murein transglycosylase B